MFDYSEAAPAAGGFVSEAGERFYRILNYDRLPPFFMTMTSPSNHWLFISSTGGLTAGRINSEHALFPYYTEDRIAENHGNTGSSTIIRLEGPGGLRIWEPFSDRCEGLYRITRSLLKNRTGNKIVFVERNEDLGLSFRLMWTAAPRLGIVKRSAIVNDSSEARSFTLLDGIMNILPGNVESATQNRFSNVLDAYKRQEADPETGLALYYLNSEMSDRAEPAESLTAVTWWQRGLEPERVLLSSDQLPLFRRSGDVRSETEVRGRRGAFHLLSALALEPGESRQWYFCGEVDQSHADICDLRRFLSRPSGSVLDELEKQIGDASVELERIIGRNDGLQVSGREMSSAHHAANVLFNTMRGGYFVDLSRLKRADIMEYLLTRSRTLPAADLARFERLPDTCSWEAFREAAAAAEGRDTVRIAGEFLPLTFSRRHGDPSRPWNRFSIHTENPDGSPKIGYEGNWRDIFQNWEATLRSFPFFIFNAVRRFLNSTTADGYNPYRITAAGVDWERPDADDPWSNIGYWSDHQIIYLAKLLELAEDHYPGSLAAMLYREESVFTEIPYRIRPLEEIFRDPRNTIDFDEPKDRLLTERRERLGEDGVLLRDENGEILYASAAEKILILILAKLVNYVPDGGIWMNTQRPEWNDANNALAGYGLSMVTLAYMDRFLSFLLDRLGTEQTPYPVHAPVMELLDRIESVLAENLPPSEAPFSARQRRDMMVRLGTAGSRYREALYEGAFGNARKELEPGRLRSFLKLVLRHIEATMAGNWREDGLFHSYNRLELRTGEASVLHLYEMLEGQVAVLSAPFCSARRAAAICAAMRNGSLYREDQKSCMLYPERTLKGFLEKNTIRAEELERYPRISGAAGGLLDGILEKDRDGLYHFLPRLRNGAALRRAVETGQTGGGRLAPELLEELLSLYEATFDHSSFTGRSGTFFAYEGLGSIYWHMVSKLLLAVQEKLSEAWRNGDEQTAAALKEAYLEIRNGLGYRKSVEEYGAFPADPYSHTPRGAGAKQPGMTGQVKEEILTRFLENGLLVRGGRIFFTSLLVDDEEFLPSPGLLNYYGADGRAGSLEVPSGGFAFTFCGVPVFVAKGESRLEVHYRDGRVRISTEPVCTPEESRALFDRTGVVERVSITLDGQKSGEPLLSSPGGR